MSMIIRTIDQKRGAWIDDSPSIGFHLMVMNNGFQASGALIGDLETAKAARHVLDVWIQRRQIEALEVSMGMKEDSKGADNN